MTDAYDSKEKRKALDKALGTLSDHLVRPSKLKVDSGPALGRGGFGEVRRAVLNEGSLFRPKRTVVAVKRLFPHSQDQVRVALRLTREVAIWSKLEHPNVLPFIGFYLDLKVKQTAYLVSPFLANGSIRSYLTRHPKTTCEQRLSWIKNMTDGLQYLHTLEPAVVHGDLKADNILLNDDLVPVLCDFGLSLMDEEMSQSGLTTSQSFKGSLRWCSPEVLNGERRNTASDVWSWPLAVIEVLTGKSPYWMELNEMALVKRIVEGEPPSPMEYSDIQSEDLIWPILRACLVKAPEKRPNIGEVRARLAKMEEDQRQSVAHLYLSLGNRRSGGAANCTSELQKVNLPQKLWCRCEMDGDKAVVNGPDNDIYKGLAWGRVPVALKNSKRWIPQETEVTRIVEAWSKIQHENILNCYGWCAFDNRVYIVSRWAQGGNLMQWLTGNTLVNSQQRVRLMEEILLGMKYLHTQGHIHGNLTPSNILVDAFGHPVISDLRFPSAGSQTAILEICSMATVHWRYQAPELWEVPGYLGKECDIYSWSMVALLIASDRVPFYNDSSRIEAQYRRLSSPGGLDRESHLSPLFAEVPQLWEILASCWPRNRSERASVEIVHRQLNDILVNVWGHEYFRV